VQEAHQFYMPQQQQEHQLQPHQLQYNHDPASYQPQGYSQHIPHQQKTTPGGTGPTMQTPDQKRGKRAGTNANSNHQAYAQQPISEQPSNIQNSTSESAGGVQ
jgi:hypothetical protein